ncbi:uncharacterized membrane protein YsdA (DUF1294 family) [Rhizobium rosettiformans]|uniref:DUF1294 domain-containing protein n=2 Tax=Rhizobium rosettiformans TaxID=1368430 RepID=A0A4S8PY08_9HYPH|nr:DUF1294 domain-containing protein [Rhizobium rosettiformans]MBB5277668.1 uncharacterized membrane protein YsdA (DUF1294 family) [Rhizobium rosettiformans]THV33119.1 DUF1294 domain-containing protein [Rhizobium rosettiformans W3]
MTIDSLFTLLAVFALWNGLVFGVYAFDKIAAQQGGWRVREDTLILLAIAGGGPGALLCQRLLRHKTRKQPFPVLLPLTAALHLVLLVVFGLFPQLVSQVIG